jgi:hypothetical protein
MSDSHAFPSHERFANLNDENYLEWRDNMLGLLKIKGLRDHIAKVHDAAETDDQKAAGLIWTRVEHQQRAHLLADTDSAHAMWEKLRAKHEQIGPQVVWSCLFGIFQETRYQEGTKLEDHLAKMKQYFTRLEASNNALTEQIKVCAILISLPQSWSVFKQMHTAAASASATQTVSGICIAALTERDRRLNEERAATATQTLAQQLAESPSALAVRQPQPARAGSRDDITCTYCLKPRHEEKDCYRKRDGKPRVTRRSSANLVTEPAASASLNSDLQVWTTLSTTPDAGVWYLDSGASNHYCHETSLVDSVQPCAKPHVISADGSRVPIVGSGSVTISVSPAVRGQPDRIVKLTDVCLVPGLTTNLVSVARLTSAGLNLRFSTLLCVIRRGKQVVAVADLDKANNLYRLRTGGRPQTSTAVVVSAPRPQYCLAVGKEAELLPSALWHQRLGHVHQRAVATLLSRGMTADVHQTISGDAAVCIACIRGKHHRTAVPADARAHRADRLLYRLHLDICGPFIVAHNGCLYLLQIVDDCSRYVWSRATINRTALTILGFLEQFVTMAEAMHSGLRVSILRSDNGPELVSGVFDSWLKARGIRRELTSTYTASQNGVVERMNRTIVEMGRTMLAAACLPASFWALAMDTAVYCRNRCPTTALDGRTPYEAWCGSKPRVAHMRIFGCLAYSHVRKALRGKADAKAKPCIFVGYSPDSTTYRLWDQQSGKLIVSRDVYFVEGQLGIKAWGATAESALPASLQPQLASIDSDWEDDELPALVPPPNALLPPPPSHLLQQPQPAAVAAPAQPVHQPQPAAAPAQAVHQPQPDLAPSPAASAPAVVAQRRALSREEKRLQDRLTSGPQDHAPSTIAQFALMAMTMSTKAVNASLPSDPPTYKAAMSSDQRASWRRAMDSEMDSIGKAGTWTLVPPPAGRSAIGCKWVFRTKRGADGSVIKHKARLVAKGFLQRYGVDYEETYAPVARYPSIRAILALAAHHDWLLHQMDVRSAYLNGELEEDIYMEQPEGYVAVGQEQLVCKLSKALYGLKQAGRTWHTKIDIALKRQQFTALDADHCVYVRRQDACITIIALYVDDLLIACSHPAHLARVKQGLTAQFEMEDLGEASFLLGIDISRDRARRSISIGQSAYVTALLERHGMSDCKPCSTPTAKDFIATVAKASAADSRADRASEAVIRDYQTVIGGLMFAMICTRPDIAYAINTLAQFASNPLPVHSQALKRVLRYLRGTVDRRVTYTGTDAADSQPELIGYSDASWGGGAGSRSVTGYAFMLAGGVISWQSAKQKTVALSTVEAEYMATAAAVKEAIWWRSFFSGLGHDTSRPTALYSDSQGSIALAHNPDHHARTKHIDIRYHFIRQHVADKTIALTFVGTQAMAADIFTKPLEYVAYERGARMLGLSESSSRGGVSEAS